MEELRVQVYLRRRGETIADGTEFKTEQYTNRDELFEAIIDFVDGVLNELEDGYDTD